jgi:hypothetical protein
MREKGRARKILVDGVQWKEAKGEELSSFILVTWRELARTDVKRHAGLSLIVTDAGHKRSHFSATKKKPGQKALSRSQP